MSFIEMLRAARQSDTSVVHEFLTQYDPNARRVYAFFEGHDDIVFFSPHIERALAGGERLCPYRCDGKAKVYKALEDVTSRYPGIRRALFFVDKDVDDIVGTPWPSDPRVFVTDVYSIENYLVCAEVYRRLLRDGVKLTGMVVDENAMLAHFEASLAEFRNQMLTVMAWLVLSRRQGERPLAANIQLAEICRLTDQGDVKATRGARLKCLVSRTGVAAPPKVWMRIRDTRRELLRLPAQRVVRGKFEAWFVVRYWRMVVSDLTALAAQGGGKCLPQLQLTDDSFVRTLSSFAETPPALRSFLSAHLGVGVVAESVPASVRDAPSLWRRIRRLWA